MTTLASSHVESLKTSLLQLSATGSDGFEGLMATALTDITGIPFRVAASGSQFGSDGSAASQDDGVYFECKRYKDTIPRREVLSKIADLSIRSTSVEAWFLCATSEVSAQIARDVQEIGRRVGIATFVLDWTGALPPLAVALAMSTNATQHLAAADTTASVAAVLEAIRADSGFNARAEQLRRDLLEPLVGTETARQANAAWLTAAFANRDQATIAFGEPLSPLDEAHGLARPRADLVAKVVPFLTGDTAGTTLCVLGGEGVGKSWLVAHCWSRVNRRPLLVVLSPRDCQAAAWPDDCEALLASRLPAQTGDPVNDVVVAGWHRKLARWRNCSRPDRARLIVVIDGVNQRPQIDWARVIDAFGDALSRIGGRLIVTARTTYYETSLQPRLMTAVEELTVPEWTATDRDEILAENGIDHAVLHRGEEAHAAVGRSLLNPRLLGIAVRLLKGRTVEHIEELSVNRLLFEHLRTREQESRSPEPAHACVRRLRTHAQEILTRHKKGLSDDVTVFDAEDVQTVADGRYFVPVDGDPTRYALQDDGLVLALGFVVIDRLRSASRNDRDLAAELAAVIDPIAALDQTATVLAAALTCACIDDSQPDEIAVALLCAFAELQNPNHEDLEAFRALARTRSLAFLEAARHLCLTGWRQPNVDWIEAALVSSRTHAKAWRHVQTAVRRWLGSYSLSPEPGMRSRRELSVEERTKRTKQIDKNLQSLSSVEKRLLESMEETDGDVGPLFRLAFTLMAGGPIAPFAKGLVQWCLANLINQNQGRLYRELEYIVRLNRCDWPAARAALLSESTLLRTAAVSNAGTWALVVLLRATGDPDDANRAEALTAKISDFMPRSWRLVEEYCASDPCDPSALTPVNVASTACQYETIDVSSLYGGTHRSRDDLFFEMARPGVVRFQGDVAVKKHQELADDVLRRQGLSLKPGLFLLRPHSALLTTKEAVTLANAGEDCLHAVDDLPARDRWVVSQERLLLAFPKLSGEEQLKALLRTRAGDDVLRSLFAVMKPVDETVFERYFYRACYENNTRNQYFLLAFARGSGTPISRQVREHIASLMSSESALVRMAVFERILRLQDEKLMRLVVDGAWRAEKVEERNGYENAYGSAILVEGAARKWISVDEALARISPAHYGWAARRLGPPAARKIATIVDASIKAAIGIYVRDAVPDVEFRSRHDDQADPFPYRLAEREIESSDVGELWKRYSESDEEFEERQKRLIDAFNTFKRKLDDASAGIVVNDITRKEFEKIVNADPDAADRWFSLFLNLNETARASIHNLVLMLAYALRKQCPERAVALLRSVSKESPFIRFTEGRARVPLDAMVAWSAAGSDAGCEWCHERLNLARNDHELATEVLAALLNREETALGAFISERLNKGEPEGIARALLVAGFSGQQEQNKDVISCHKEVKGFIGEAYKAAKYAHDRDRWTRHWYGQMCRADGPKEFWRYSVLFTKIVDGRFTVWSSDYERRSETMVLFESSIDEEVDRRIEEWRKHREKTLFGATKPADVFLPGRAGAG